MQSRALTSFKWFSSVLALALNFFIYFYPDILNPTGTCTWHEFNGPSKIESKLSFLNKLPENWSQKLLLNFPSLSKDTSIDSPRTEQGSIKDIHLLTFGDPQINGNWPSTKYIKRLDNYGNDYYLGHIYKTMKERLHPSHVVVMGDLFSSQWILDSEFYNRTHRLVERIFVRPMEYKKNVVETFEKHENYDWVTFMNNEHQLDPDQRFASRVYEDVYDWFHNRTFPNHKSPLFINLTGNHDIGYSGDATWQHMARFHHLFGQNNYVLNYNKGQEEEWRLIVLDSLTLEGPALQPEFTNYTWSFLDNIKEKENPNFKGSTVLMTHIPLYKEEGLCTDGPEHKYYITNEREPYKVGKLRSQNHLAQDVSQKILEIVFPNKDQSGVILTGHDHVGCDTWYNYEHDKWIASKTKDSSERNSVREIVVRSMMGDFDGQTGIFTGHFDYNLKKWLFEFTYCSFAVQHWWWATKVTTLVAILLHSLDILL